MNTPVISRLFKDPTPSRQLQGQMKDDFEDGLTLFQVIQFVESIKLFLKQKESNKSLPKFT